MNEEQKFTEKDLDSCWLHQQAYFIEILNGDYDLNEARNDLRELVGSKYDLRIKNAGA